MRPFLFLMTTALVTTLSVGAQAEQQPVSTVTLSTSGLGEYTRPVPYEEGGMKTEITARLSEMDDVLKSLVILGSNIETAVLSVGSSQALSDVFETLPFSPGDLSRPEALLSRLPGVLVRLSNEDEVTEGRVMGVAQDVPCGMEAECPAVVMVMTDQGSLKRVSLWDDVELEILDEETKKAVARGLDALQEHGSENTRTVLVDITPKAGSEAAPVMVSTVLPAPIWKPAYRGVIAQGGEIELQAWAVVENASGEDWDDIVLTLTSGNPQTLDANLYARTYGHRPPADEMARMLKQSFSGNQTIMARAAPSPMMEETMMAADSMEIAPMAPQAAASEGDSGARFTFDKPVTIAAGEVASVPFLGGALDAKMTAYHRGGTYGGVYQPPQRVLDVKNTLDVRLPPGIATLYHNDEGYLGDANIPEIHAQEHRVLPFGSETRLRVREVIENNTRETNLRISDGMLFITAEQVIVSRYDVKGPASGSGEILVDHPVKEGYSFKVVSGGEPEKVLLNREEDVWRFDLNLKTDEEVGIRIRETRPQTTRIVLANMSDDQVLAYASRTTNPEMKVFFNRLIELRRSEGEASRALSRFEQERNSLVSEQRRLSGLLENMSAGSEAHDRFSASILRLEDQLEDMDEQETVLRQALLEAQTETRAFLNNN